ncbi:CO(2)-response secreted protease [Hibiscus syriacus]|uniref:CO(2)-response secreted protease n=1 Tax=Hibiscus syriacus TaxID=106335 RepID=A0A6A3BAN0_HIBSY|nr:CO(2)-response secreted protease [Hibiscus syriacus]
MKPLVPFIFSLTSFLIYVSLLTEIGGAAEEKDGVYIVYMGAAPSTNGSLRDDHAQLMSSLLKRKKDALIHSYKNGFTGFAAHLSADEAHSIAKRQGVVSVFPDPVLELHTTRSWDFLNFQTSVVIDSNPGLNSNSTSHDSDAIIGILDTGIWPESESFNDKAMGPIPSRWNGTCAAAQDFNTSNCNKKIIGARSYDVDERSVIRYHSPRDMVGHGTHVASTAAGSEVQGTSYYGLAAGTAKGGSPGSRIAVYRVCSPFNGCRGSSILAAAFDDAIADGVDVLSLSLGSSSFIKPQITDDPIALGAFHAVQHGITVVCSAGNDGPDPGSVVNAAPWIITVAASTIDRDFESDVILGDNSVIKVVILFFILFLVFQSVGFVISLLLTRTQGGGIHFADIQKSPAYPIIYAKSAKKKEADVNDSRNCHPDSLDQELVKGKIVVCEHVDNFYSVSEKKDEVKKLGGVGAVVIDDESRQLASSYGTFPTSVIRTEDNTKVLSYINSTKNPVATILRTTSPTKYTPAPTIAYFSSRGPSTIPKNILKPDIAAPGVNILAAWIANDTAEAPEGKEPPLYNLISGTSMACPHVSGIAATKGAAIV